MGLKTMSVQEGAVTVSATGGTTLTFAEDGQTIQNGVHLIVPADSDYATRRSLTVKYRPPTLNPKTGSYTKDKKSMVFTRPVILTDGSVAFNVLRIEREIVPSTSVAERDMLNIVGAQLLVDSEAGSYWATGSMA